MIKGKQRVSICFSCVLLFAKPSYAFIPTFDAVEAIPVVKEVSTSLETLGKIQAQFSELSTMLKSLGTEVGIAGFVNFLDDIDDTVSGACGGVLNTISQGEGIIGQVTDVVDLTQGADDILGGQMIDQIGNVLGEGGEGNILSGVLGGVTGGADDLSGVLGGVTGSGNSPLDSIIGGTSSRGGSSFDNILGNVFGNSLVEEEEEEEEVTDGRKTEITNIIKLYKEEYGRLFDQLNDVFDATLAVMNKNADSNRENFEIISTSLSSSKSELDETTQRELLKQIEETREQEKKVTEWGINIVEAMRNKYNKEHKQKITDGLNNYEKVVLGYLDGNVSKEELINQSRKIRQEISSIRAVPDSGTLIKYKEENEAVKVKTSQLAESIKKAFADK